MRDLEDKLCILQVNKGLIFKFGTIKNNNIKFFIWQNQINLLPNQMQAVIIEQNKMILEKFSFIQKQLSLSCSGANSIDGENNATSNALQIPTISTNVNR
jgi:hypothetical protein